MISFIEWMKRLNETESLGEKPRSTDILYVAAMLTRESQVELWETVSRITEIPNNWKKFCHHMTIRFKPTDDSQLPIFGEDITITALELSVDDKGATVRVEPDTSNFSMPTEQIPHITIATAPQVSPVYSNELLRKNIGVRLPEPLNLKAFIGAKMKSGPIMPERRDIALESF